MAREEESTQNQRENYLQFKQSERYISQQAIILREKVQNYYGRNWAKRAENSSRGRKIISIGARKKGRTSHSSDHNNNYIFKEGLGIYLYQMKEQTFRLVTSTGYHCTICNKKLASSKASHIKDHTSSTKHLKQVRHADSLNTQNNGGRLSQPTKESPDVIAQDPSLKMVDVLSKASPRLNTIDFKQAAKTRGISDQVELNGGLGHKNEVFSCDHNGQLQEADGHSQQKTFTTTYVTDWEILSRACSSMSQMSEAAKLLLQEKDKQVTELKERVKRLEEKLETKDCELIQLRSQVGGLEVQCLKIKLAEATVRLDERDKQLSEWKIIADGLIKNNASFDEFKQQMQNMSAQASACPSLDQSVSCSQDGQEQHDQSMENQEQELKKAYCCYCDRTTSKLIAEHYWECELWKRFAAVIECYGKQWKVKLGDFQLKDDKKHITLFPHYVQMFNGFKNDLNDDDVEDLQLFEKLQNDSQVAVAIDSQKTRQIENFRPHKPDNDVKMINTALRQVFLGNVSSNKLCDFSKNSTGKILGKRSYGALRKRQDNIGWNNVTKDLQENSLSQLKMKEFRYRCATCKKLFSCEISWIKHSEYMLKCGRTCICDVFSFQKYVYSVRGTSLKHFKRDIKGKELKKLEALIATTMEKPQLIKAEKFKSALETRRDIQREESLTFVISKKNQLATVEAWQEKLAKECQKGELQALGNPICDAIVYPRCPLIFGNEISEHDKQLTVFLKFYNIPIRSIGNVATNDTNLAFVYLLDSDNMFTRELITNLNNSFEDLAAQIKDKLAALESQQDLKTQLNNLYIRQIDYSKDFLGYFMVMSLTQHNFEALRLIEEIIRMKFSQHHSQLCTSIQFESYIDGTRSERLKVYNKWVHLLSTTSFKYKLSMGTNKLFKAPMAFQHKKLQPSFDHGLTRVELSAYFNSINEWKQKTLDFDSWEQKIACVQNALHSIQETLIYQVNFKVFWDSFWFSVDAATTIIVFEPDIWTVVYSYCQRSYLYTGHHVDRHNKSGAQLTFLQRFTGKKTLVRVNNGTETEEFLIHKQGKSRQIPIHSLNIVQREVYRFPIDLDRWFYNLSKGQLDIIYFICENQEEFDRWFGQDPVFGRPDLNEFESQFYDNGQLFQERNTIFDIVLQVGEPQRKKRAAKLGEKNEVDETKKDRNNSLAPETMHWKKKGKHSSGKQRWECLKCSYRTTDKDKAHKCD